MFFQLKILFSLLNLFFISALSGSELIINLENQKKPGTLFLSLYDNVAAYQKAINGGGEVFSKNDTFYNQRTYLELKNIHELIVDVPDGEYAIVFFVDANKNNKLDKNFIGIPKEQYGFSNNAMGSLSAPSFEQAKFSVQGKTTQNIKLK
jgi:uncharacterized protein (DUF2141 family)|tara:strand:- start:271 stop:720 length:450 start_codon:yes stop_codon:yes gene_type:complete